ncbi:MAG: L-threonylcarbamoyladenylate synthase [Gammaproteobacteria bacterium]|nr:L-threonylcarbamoyladenylate synthase [Gammaproteobacteria bacterium]
MLIEQAITHLKAGNLIGLPTETVYGLAADAKNEAAILKVFAAKGRPADHPLIVHISSIAEMEEWAIHIPKAAYTLAEKFWPGPLTLILEKASHVSKLITGGQDTIALRIPNHPLALQLLQQYGGGLVAPSANRFGRISPTDEAAVIAELAEKVALVLPGGRTEIGIESTILDVHQHPFVLMRQGMLSQVELETFLGEKIALPTAKNTLRSPGLLASHYAPLTPLHLFTHPENHPYPSAIVLSKRPRPKALPPHTEWWKMPEKPDAYAHELYAMLRQADATQKAVILVETLPQSPKWKAILDRLNRAATPS